MKPLGVGLLPGEAPRSLSRACDRVTVAVGIEGLGKLHITHSVRQLAHRAEAIALEVADDPGLALREQIEVMP